MREDLVDDDQFPMEGTAVLKWSFLAHSVPMASNGVRTRVLVGAPGKSSRKFQQPSVSHEQLLPTRRNLFADCYDVARVLLRHLHV